MNKFLIFLLLKKIQMTLKKGKKGWEKFLKIMVLTYNLY